eukprot:CAMPEP_0174703770 /NCGR_PEP_ID=MMETSP1094-20130205/7602_1 /TAXON_ID=156173 /ORGANISM="Chrysochromulina brevifilum, Strain UTEX LB 985" /LENGTH=53 /DNA_ID=CAMNT_0015901735 /DNA_START=97 /DNA_END=258 /DNA_ORIENTATION=-
MKAATAAVAGSIVICALVLLGVAMYLWRAVARFIEKTLISEKAEARGTPVSAA